MTQEFPEVIRIGTRKSKLALAQAETVRAHLLACWPELAAPGRLELAPMLTTGDRITDRPLSEIGGKGLFAKELDDALINNKIELAVHSTKDIESLLPNGISLISTLEREDNRDAFISASGTGFAGMPEGARIGTVSVRRAAQALIQRPDITIATLRGNVPTRLEKVAFGEVDGAFLALAGLKRLGLEAEVTEICARDTFLPAACQGIIGITCRTEDAAIRHLLAPLNHAETFTAALAERALLATLDGSCRTPIAAWARLENGVLRLSGGLYAPDGSEHFLTERSSAPVDAEAMGRDAGEELKARGGHLLP